ncbi:MAG: hypothetical protein K6U75_09990 [Firmicutes bacterium]|nr:hypothetical protein [Bacillota bacterium]
MSNHVLQQAVQKSFSAVQYCEGGQFRPTLVVGLGGSGVETARRVKRILHERYQVDNLIRFLFIDTDEAQYIQDGELAKAEQHERAPISVRYPEQLLDELRRNPKLHPYFEQFWDGSNDVVLLRDASGAAGIRPAGRFAFHASFDNLFTNYLEPAIHHIMQVRERVQAMMKGASQHVEITQSIPRVYVISSLCGGTGSGIFMDTAAVIRYIFDRYGLDGEIVGIFYLPTVFRHEAGISPSMWEVIEANGYASLMELEYLCNHKTFEEDNQWEFTYRTIGSYTLRQPLFDEVFLVEGVNSGGNTISNKRYVFEMTARSIMLDIGSPLGAHARSAKRNSLAVIETMPCAETGQPRLLNSLGVTNFAVPIEELTRYCAARSALELMDQEAQNAQSHGSDMQQQIKTFVQTNHLVQTETNELVTDYLLQDDHGIPLSFKTKEVAEILQEAEGAGQTKLSQKADYAERELRRLFDSIGNDWIPSLKQRLEERARTLFDKALKEAGNRAEQVLTASGHDRARQFFVDLGNYLNELQRDLQQTAEQERAQAKTCEQEFEQACSQLKQAKPRVWELWMGNDQLQQEVQQACDTLRKYAQHRLKALAAEIALSALQELKLHGQLSEWADLVSHWQQHQQNTRLRLQNLCNTNGARYYGYDLEWFVILSKDFPRFYESIKSQISFDKIREEHYRLRQNYKHYPAFGNLSSTEIDVDTEAQLWLSAAVEVLSPVLRKHANVLELIKFQSQEERQQNGVPLKEYVDRKLQILFDACQPYWSTSQPPGEQRYESILVASIPYASNGSADGDELDQYRQQVREIAEKRGYTRVEYREDGYPFALTLMTRTYGARAYYLRSTRSMRTCYERRITKDGVRARLHVDKRFFDRLPLLEPVEQEEEHKVLWSWALAYGYIALRGNTFYYNVQRWQDHLIPKYKSEWQIALQEKLPSEWQKRLVKHIEQESEVLGSDWKVAYRKILHDKGKVEELKRAQQQLHQLLGRQSILQQMEEYESRLLDLQNATESKRVRDHISEQRKAIQSYIDFLRKSDW